MTTISTESAVSWGEFKKLFNEDRDFVDGVLQVVTQNEAGTSKEEECFARIFRNGGKNFSAMISYHNNQTFIADEEANKPPASKTFRWLGSEEQRRVARADLNVACDDVSMAQAYAEKHLKGSIFESEKAKENQIKGFADFIFERTHSDIKKIILDYYPILGKIGKYRFRMDGTIDLPRTLALPEPKEKQNSKKTDT